MFSFIWKYTKLEHLNFFYINHENTLVYNLLIGFLLGLFYALFELPNSFLKRRLGIKEGKTIKGFKKILEEILQNFYGKQYKVIFIDNLDNQSDNSTSSRSTSTRTAT